MQLFHNFNTPAVKDLFAGLETSLEDIHLQRVQLNVLGDVCNMQMKI